MKLNEIHIFCLMGKIKSGKELYLNMILNDLKFVKKMNLKRLITSTTRNIRIGEEEDKEFHFISEDEFNMMDKNYLIESRTYYTPLNSEVHYFTSPQDIYGNNNLIGITTPYQYQSYKNWIKVQNILQEKELYKLHLIYINATIKERLARMQQEIYTELDLLEISTRILQEKHEFDAASSTIPELVDPLLQNVCYISGSAYYNRNLVKIKKYIQDNVTQ